MLKLDHLAIIAPTLELGAEHVYAQLGLDMPTGGKHREMGTHNLLLRLGNDVFLEVIAVDPSASLPARPRWFGLDEIADVLSDWKEGRRLRSWITRTDDFDGMLARHGEILGRKERVSRGERSWDFAVRDDGRLPLGGVAPSMMDWGAPGSPASSMPDLGARLIGFQIEHPDPDSVRELYEKLGIIDPPEIIKGNQFRYSATIETAAGLKTLT